MTAIALNCMVTPADRLDVFALAPLFAAYQEFYGRRHSLAAVRAHLNTRIGRGDSMLLVARTNGGIVGFAQMQIGNSTLSMAPTVSIDDLFVGAEWRGTGIGRALLDACTAFARSLGAARLELITGRENTRAREIYERGGFVPDARFVRYERPLF